MAFGVVPPPPLICSGELFFFCVILHFWIFCGSWMSAWTMSGCLLRELHATSLQELILNDNLLLGTIPCQIGMLKSLTVLDLSKNRLTGPIPPEIGGLSSITTINFHSNGLTGSVPPELGDLANLLELRLDRNKLQGSIPGSSSLNFTSDMHNMAGPSGQATGLCLSQRLKVADFSYNFLVGAVPPCLKYLPRTNFQGNCLEDKDSILQRSTLQCEKRLEAAIQELERVKASEAAALDELKFFSERAFKARASSKKTLESELSKRRDQEEVAMAMNLQLVAGPRKSVIESLSFPGSVLL